MADDEKRPTTKDGRYYVDAVGRPVEKVRPDRDEFTGGGGRYVRDAKGNRTLASPAAKPVVHVDEQSEHRAPEVTENG